MGRANDWYEILGYALVQDEETNFDQLEQALKKSFPVVRNKAELEARFFASYQTRNQAPVDFVYELLKLQKALKKGIRPGKLRVRVQIVIGKDEIGMCFGSLTMIVEIEVAGMQKFWIDKKNRKDNYRSAYENGLHRNHGFKNRNQFDRDNRRFESSNGLYQFRNRSPSDNFNRGDRRQGGRLNSLKVRVDQDD
ncbi:uncharacterized protein TNCV_811461 [Trichonephila clavipes]|nr:uncharacterized protein TNCV_811461 [Trichonephila clavipes]